MPDRDTLIEIDTAKPESTGSLKLIRGRPIALRPSEVIALEIEPRQHPSELERPPHTRLHMPNLGVVLYDPPRVVADLLGLRVYNGLEEAATRTIDVDEAVRKLRRE